MVELEVRRSSSGGCDGGDGGGGGVDQRELLSQSGTFLLTIITWIWEEGGVGFSERGGRV